MTSTPVIIPRPEHCISRGDISENALKVLYRLKKAGYAAYLVGGSVRDLLLHRQPKDFDVATDATPEEVRALFRNCRLIGRRFRLAHVHFGREIIEVATFRGHHDQANDGEGLIEDGMILRDNVFGSLEDDAWRRDFRVNALYYNIEDFSVIDYTDGMQDLDDGVIRMIGDAGQRFQEDPVRMLRAVRFAAKLDFTLDAAVAEEILALGARLDAVPPARLFDEVLKLFMSGHALVTFELMHRYRMFEHLFRDTADFLQQEDEYTFVFLSQALRNTDQRIHANKPVTPAFLFATLLWSPVRRLAGQLQTGKMSELQALQQAGHEVINDALQQVAIPRRFRTPMLEIWTGQARLAQRRGRRSLRHAEHPRFRAAYDFLLLRQHAGEPLQELCEWWTRLQEQDDEGRKAMCDALRSAPAKKRRRRKRKSATSPGTE